MTVDEPYRDRVPPAGTSDFWGIGQGGYAGDMPGCREQSPTSSILAGTSPSPERSDDGGAAGAGGALTGARRPAPSPATASALDPTRTRAPACPGSTTLLAAQPRAPPP